MIRSAIAVAIVTNAVHAADNKATLSLLSSVSAVAPGAEFEIGIRFDIEKEWHIYWSNPGDAGLPPSFTWTLPEGFELGEITFPVPGRHEAAGLVTNILEGAPMLTVRVKAPAELPEGGVTIKTAAKWLICKEMCLLETQESALMLPVAASTGDVKDANAEQFEWAHRAQPTPTAKAKYLKLSATPPSGPVEVGGTVEVQLALELEEGYHIQSDKPSLPGLVGTDVFFERTPGVDVGQPRYPNAQVRKVPELGSLSEFTGETVIRIPVTVTDEAQGAELPLSGVLIYQACSEATGVCYPPEHAAWSTTIRRK